MHIDAVESDFDQKNLFWQSTRIINKKECFDSTSTTTSIHRSNRYQEQQQFPINEHHIWRNKMLRRQFQRYLVLMVVWCFIISGVVESAKDSNSYPWGNNPNTKYRMYWKDADNVLQDLSQFHSIYVKYHGCVWSECGVDQFDDDGEGQDGSSTWYQNRIQPFCANSAFSLYGILRSPSTSSMASTLYETLGKVSLLPRCSRITYINSFFTYNGADTLLAALGLEDSTSMTALSSAYNNGNNNNNKNNNNNNNNGYGNNPNSVCYSANNNNNNNGNAISTTMGCTVDYKYGIATFQGNDCDGNYFLNITEEAIDYNHMMSNINCHKVYDSSWSFWEQSSSSYGQQDQRGNRRLEDYSASSYGSAVEMLLKYSWACDIDMYPNECPDPYGLKKKYNNRLNAVAVTSRSYSSNPLVASYRRFTAKSLPWIPLYYFLSVITFAIGMFFLCKAYKTAKKEAIEKYGGGMSGFLASLLVDLKRSGRNGLRGLARGIRRVYQTLRLWFYGTMKSLRKERRRRHKTRNSKSLSDDDNRKSSSFKDNDNPKNSSGKNRTSSRTRSRSNSTREDDYDEYHDISNINRNDILGSQGKTRDDENKSNNRKNRTTHTQHPIEVSNQDGLMRSQTRSIPQTQIETEYDDQGFYYELNEKSGQHLEANQYDQNTVVDLSSDPVFDSTVPYHDIESNLSNDPVWDDKVRRLPPPRRRSSSRKTEDKAVSSEPMIAETNATTQRQLTQPEEQPESSNRYASLQSSRSWPWNLTKKKDATGEKHTGKKKRAQIGASGDRQQERNNEHELKNPHAESRKNEKIDELQTERSRNADTHMQVQSETEKTIVTSIMANIQKMRELIDPEIVPTDSSHSIPQPPQEQQLQTHSNNTVPANEQLVQSMLSEMNRIRGEQQTSANGPTQKDGITSEHVTNKIAANAVEDKNKTSLPNVVMAQSKQLDKKNVLPPSSAIQASSPPAFESVDFSSTFFLVGQTQADIDDALFQDGTVNKDTPVKSTLIDLTEESSLRHRSGDMLSSRGNISQGVSGTTTNHDLAVPTNSNRAKSPPKSKTSLPNDKTSIHVSPNTAPSNSAHDGKKSSSFSSPSPLKKSSIQISNSPNDIPLLSKASARLNESFQLLKDEVHAPTSPSFSRIEAASRPGATMNEPKPPPSSRWPKIQASTDTGGLYWTPNRPLRPSFSQARPDYRIPRAQNDATVDSNPTADHFHGEYPSLDRPILSEDSLMNHLTAALKEDHRRPYNSHSYHGRKSAINEDNGGFIRIAHDQDYLSIQEVNSSSFPYDNHNNERKSHHPYPNGSRLSHWSQSSTINNPSTQAYVSTPIHTNEEIARNTISPSSFGNYPTVQGQQQRILRQPSDGESLLIASSNS